MLKKILLLLLLAPGPAFSQTEYSRFSLSPYLSLGMRFPAKKEIISGSEQMSYLWKFYNFGRTFDVNGDTQISFNSTNRIGLNLNYRLSGKTDIFGRAERINLITSYQSSLTYDYLGNQVGGFYDNFNYYSLGAGFRYRTYNLFFTGAVNFQPDIFGPRNRRAARNGTADDPGNYVNSAGTGLSFSYTVSQPQRLSFYVGIGQKIDLFNGPAFFELGLNLSPAILYTERVDFFSNNSQIGQNRLEHRTNAFFVTLSQPFNFKKRDPRRKREMPERREPEEVEEFEIGERIISIGQNLVLEHIQFEQSKANLSLDAMGELDRVFDFMVRYPQASIQLSGHTSAEGSRRQNITLSEHRAEACKDYLIRKGVAKSRIKTVGYGPDKPLSDENQELNRRVELLILRIKE